MRTPQQIRDKEQKIAIEVEFRRKSGCPRPGESLLYRGKRKRWSRFFKDGNELVAFLQDLNDTYKLTSRTIKYKSKKNKKIFVLEIEDSPPGPDTAFPGILGQA